ncbi:MAG: glyoxalase/bleomycin resistance/dioxygenase family protein [Polaromonas sp.]|nr:glyoxalase/bleomycin resistance/dioxygenase family protein [Polaromonas sp.]
MTSDRKTIGGLDHIGLTVPDIELATAFFNDVLGCTTLFDVGPFEANDNWMTDYLAVDARAKLPKVRMLKTASGGMLELFQYQTKDQVTIPPRNSDVGGHHVCFYVEDMEAALAHLRAHGVKLLAGPVHMTEGPSAGLSWIYFMAPWGMQLELASYPHGMAYQTSMQ